MSSESDVARRRARAVERVEAFWSRVWDPPHDLDAVNDFVTDDFVITTGGVDIAGRDAFVEWIRGFQSRAADFKLISDETFANADATRVSSRWHATAINHGAFGLPSDDRAFALTGISIWEVTWIDEEPKLAHNWVERSAWEAYVSLRERKQERNEP